MSIEIKNLTKNYGNYKAVSDVSFTVGSGELFALLGPSGCGKTTLLRSIAGLEIPDGGNILLNGKDTTELSPKDRNVGFVFQHFALFKHMSVFDNVAFGLNVKPKKERLPKNEIEERVMKLLKLVQMEWSAKSYPAKLSGGQRQRIALARALAVEPKVLLLDEPFSALDAKVRQELRRWLKKLHDEIHVTSIFVTHDQEEALELADKILILNKGKLEQIGTPSEVYENPVNPFVYNFMGNVNTFHLRNSHVKSKICVSDLSAPEDSDSTGFVRPHDVKIFKENNSAEAIPAVVKVIRIMKSQVGLELDCLSMPGFVEAEISYEKYRELKIKKDDRVFIELKNVKYFTKDSYEI